MEISKIIANELKLETKHVENVLSMLDEGNTIAFIARYRKDKTGNMTDNTLRLLQKTAERISNLEKRREEIVNILNNDKKLDPKIEKRLREAKSISELEDIYDPFRKKKTTRAMIARQMGLESLLDLILSPKTEKEIQKEAEQFIGDEDLDSIFQRTMDILSEDISLNIDFKNILRKDALLRAVIKTENKNDIDRLYENYYDKTYKIRDIKAHQWLAINRAANTDKLNVRFEFSDEYNKTLIFNKIKTGSKFSDEFIKKAIDDSYKRLMLPKIITEVKNYLGEKSEEKSIDLFAQNLKSYIMQRPFKDKVIMGLDPGYISGCKVCVIDKKGKYLESGVIYPVKPKCQEEQSMKFLKKLIEKYQVNLIALGNKTASRETESFICKLIENMDKEISYTMVNEAGASIYSASKVAEDEFPELDVTIRGAISIARRLQDPMAELVKIEPEHLGIGQYQHDLNAKKLKLKLNETIEDCVNEVGVNINNASSCLLNYVSGLNTTLANRIELAVKNNELKRREDLKKIKGLGEKTYKMASGFLRFPDSPEMLDNTAVHPESYEIAKEILKMDINTNNLNVEKLSETLNIGIHTLNDILTELKKPGRDPRDDFPEILTAKSIRTIDDLKEGDVLRGKVRNIVDFGVFVDIGVGIDGLVYISEISDRYVKNIQEFVHVSDVVEVRVLNVDKKRERISLSLK